MKKVVSPRKGKSNSIPLSSLSRKCDAILSKLDVIQQQVQNYPKTFADSIENLYKAAEELSDVCKKKKGLNKG